jgi:4-hydroxybenzoate polyprenyltransferase
LRGKLEEGATATRGAKIAGHTLDDPFAFFSSAFYSFMQMLGPLSQRILTVLQLTRMALVFTAISNGMCEALLMAAYRQPRGDYLDNIDPKTLVAMAAVSIGLYGFGMSLNDIIDRRRDSRIAAYRPLPSGRIRLVTAHAICVCLALLAGWGGAAYAHWTPRTGNLSLCFLFITGMLITFYDFAGKYLVALGLLSLGMIRFLQAAIAAPIVPVLWHPLLLLNHVTILSAVAYHWEQKRPPLTRKHWLTVLGGLGLLDLGLIIAFGIRRGDKTLGGMLTALEVNASLLPAVLAVLAFVGIAVLIRRQNSTPADAGQKLMLYGLLWLIVYDAAFVAGYVSWVAAGILLCLLPIAYWSVQLMRWWSKLVSVAQRPVFQRARN